MSDDNEGDQQNKKREKERGEAGRTKREYYLDGRREDGKCKSE